MPKVKVNDININYDQQGSGEPIVLIPYLAADHACYAFQVPEYAKHFTCISLDPRGAGSTDKPDGVYSTELFADDVAAFMPARYADSRTIELVLHRVRLEIGELCGLEAVRERSVGHRYRRVHADDP